VNDRVMNESLSITHPEIAKEAHGWDPKFVSRGSTKKVEWKCINGHLFLAAPNTRTRKATIGKHGKKGPSGCPYCANQKVLKGFNDLLSQFPEIASEAHEWNPAEVVWGSAKKVSWRCKSGHIWLATISSRTHQQTGCPVCRNLIVVKGINDLETTHPALINELVDTDPSKVHAGSKKKVSWKCKQGHRWTTSINLRTKRNLGCPYCSNQKLLVGYNDLATTHPELASEADGWNPSTFTAGSLKKVSWCCPKGHRYDSVIRDRAQRKTECVYCVGKKVLSGFNDLLTTHPDLASQAFQWDPKTVSAGSSSKKLAWICDKGHVWKSVVANRIRENSGCPFCKNKALLVGFNDLKTVEPSLAREANGWDPSTVMIGSGKKLQWKCSEGHTWFARVISRTSAHKTGCPSCAKSGFDPNESGYLYLIKHEAWEMTQIGITNDPATRLKRHESSGWVLCDLKGPMDGLLARGWEQSILSFLNLSGVKLGLEEVAGKFDGFTEAWSSQQFKVKTLNEIMDLVRKHEENL
jgi:hypothetical protein